MKRVVLRVLDAVVLVAGIGTVINAGLFISLALIVAQEMSIRQILAGSARPHAPLGIALALAIVVAVLTALFIVHWLGLTRSQFAAALTRKRGASVLAGRWHIALAVFIGAWAVSEVAGGVAIGLAALSWWLYEVQERAKREEAAEATGAAHLALVEQARVEERKAIAELAIAERRLWAKRLAQEDQLTD